MRPNLSANPKVSRIDLISEMAARRLSLMREGLAAASGLAVALILASSVAFQSFGDLLRVVVTGGIFWVVAIVIYLGVRRLLLQAWRRNQVEEPNRR